MPKNHIKKRRKKKKGEKGKKLAAINCKQQPPSQEKWKIEKKERSQLPQAQNKKTKLYLLEKTRGGPTKWNMHVPETGKQGLLFGGPTKKVFRTQKAYGEGEKKKKKRTAKEGDEGLGWFVTARP